jgi:hypothetical protein
MGVVVERVKSSPEHIVNTYFGFSNKEKCMLQIARNIFEGRAAEGATLLKASGFGENDSDIRRCVVEAIGICVENGLVGNAASARLTFKIDSKELGPRIHKAIDVCLDEEHRDTNTVAIVARGTEFGIEEDKLLIILLRRADAGQLSNEAEVAVAAKPLDQHRIRKLGGDGNSPEAEPIHSFRVQREALGSPKRGNKTWWGHTLRENSTDDPYA